MKNYLSVVKVALEYLIHAQVKLIRLSKLSMKELRNSPH